MTSTSSNEFELDAKWVAQIEAEARRNLVVDEDEFLVVDDWDDKWTPDTDRASQRRDFVEENGMRYHSYKQGKYLLPNDHTEQARLDFQHHLFLLSFEDRLHYAPTGDNSQHVLDLGTGTGRWAIDFATRNPKSSVLGTDLSLMVPAEYPGNVSFKVHDAEDPWDFFEKFDLIHGRALVTCFTHPLPVIKSAFSALKPGGYLEFQDLIFPVKGIDDTYTGSAIFKMQDLTQTAARKIGKNLSHSNHYVKYFEEAGFVDVVVKHFQWPIGPWPKGEALKKIGAGFQYENVNSSMGFVMALLTRGLGWKEEDVKVLIEENRQALLDPKIHSYMPGVVVYGKKPEN